MKRAARNDVFSLPQLRGKIFKKVKKVDFPNSFLNRIKGGKCQAQNAEIVVHASNSMQNKFRVGKTSKYLHYFFNLVQSLIFLGVQYNCGINNSYSILC